MTKGMRPFIWLLMWMQAIDLKNTDFKEYIPFFKKKKKNSVKF